MTRSRCLANLEAGTQIVGRGATMLRDGDRIAVAGGGGPRKVRPGGGDEAKKGGVKKAAT
jgi:hypothetical protein